MKYISRRRKKPVKPNGYQMFWQGLRDLGFKSYDEYLHSDVWKAFNQWYRQSPKHPQECLVCGLKQFVLHHWTYMRVGMEDLQDVIPLCERHHTELHSYLASTNTKIDDVVGQFVNCFGFEVKTARSKLRHIFKKRAPVKSVESLNAKNARRKRWNDRQKKKKWVPDPNADRTPCSKCNKLRLTKNMTVDGHCMACVRIASKANKSSITGP